MLSFHAPEVKRYMNVGVPADRPILVVEDEDEVAATILTMLERDGWTAIHASSLDQGLARLQEFDPAIVIVDLGLPDGSGMTIVREAAARVATGVIVVSGRCDEVDRVVGLEVGADDYIAKPFSAREMNARVRALQRRIGRDRHVDVGPRMARAPRKPLTVQGTTLDPARLRVTGADGTSANLTSGEAELLAQLIEAGDEPLSREVVAEKVLGHRLQPQQRGVDQLASSLRQKIERVSGGAIRIVAARGKGYRLIV
ncbi:response regulator transcription factor [Roseococcus sp. SDR]|uniref:response regulator transcription factor n=1 Tax=Roseococcus sp. SDR TaxID=2835532 RepID=UPI001BCCD568|nr:response regulator transcription factor [Roseococcus sp. SDR]MBS7789737.1 response regulator transcription factor [Roseococcus sp. SDR]MBV1845051.1 response regulator transcription factor [Roseococcus sp. SDR]